MDRQMRCQWAARCSQLATRCGQMFARLFAGHQMQLVSQQAQSLGHPM